MKLVWHIIAKDLRQGKWALGFWVLLYLMHQALGSVFLNTDGTDLEWIDQLRWTNLLLTGLEFVVGFVLALRWVQADELSGTRMFWVTRPISGGRLFAAKLLGLVLVFGLLPEALWLPWWISCGQGGRELGWLALEAFSWQLALIGPALLIGSLTDDLGRAIMWSLILVLVAMGWAFLGQSTLTAGDFRQFSRGFAGVWFSRIGVAALMVVVGFAGIAAAQYFTRNVRRAVVRVAVLGLLVVLVGRFWVYDFSAEIAGWGRPFAAEPASGAGENITLTPKQARVSAHTYKQRLEGDVENVRSLVVSFDVAGLPDEMSLEAWHSGQALRWKDGQEVRLSGSARSSTFRSDRFFRARFDLPAVRPDPETVSWGHARVKKTNAERAAKGLPPIDDYWGREEEEERRMRVFLGMPESQLERLRAAAPFYTARVDASVLKPEILQELPLEAGKRGSGRMRSLMATDIDGQLIRLADTTAAFLHDGLFRVREFLPPPRAGLRTNVWAVNRRTGDIASVGRRRLVQTAINVGGVAIVWNEIFLYPAKWIRGEEWVVKDPSWQKNTVMVMTTDVVVGSFSRSIRSEQLAVVFPPEPLSVGSSAEAASAGTN